MPIARLLTRRLGVFR